MGHWGLGAGEQARKRGWPGVRLGVCHSRGPVSGSHACCKGLRADGLGVWSVSRQQPWIRT